jgi:spore coat protein U-like protein
MKQVLVLAAVLACLGWMPRAHAAGCALDSTGGQLVNFNAYNALSGDVDATGTLSVTCTLAVAYSVSISAGGSNNFSQRLLGGRIRYNLYTDVTRLVIWGEGKPGDGTATMGGVCVAKCSLTVYGRIPGGQTAPAGTYNDSVVVTVTF